MDAASLVEDFLLTTPTETAFQLRDGLTAHVASATRAVIAHVATGGERVILLIQNDRLALVELDGGNLDITSYGAIRGATLTAHHRGVEGGLLLRGYTLRHASLPGCSLRIEASEIDQADRDRLPFELEHFLSPP